MVFRDDYGFTVYNQRLKDSPQKPELQARKYLTDFAFSEDKERRLLIVYYAGHGFSDDEVQSSDIKLTGLVYDEYPSFYEAHVQHRKLRPRHPKSKSVQGKENDILWSNVETAIKKLDAEVLLIFDCCHAGRLCPSVRGTTSYMEFFGSCSEDQTTRSAGPRSFTSALIWALRELAKEPEPFNTAKLRWKIKQHEHFPEEQVPALFPRFGSGDIVIVRRSLADTLTHAVPGKSEKERAMHYKESIDIRLHFDCLVGDDIIRSTADGIKVLKNNEKLHLNRIDFQGKFSLFEKAATLIRQRSVSAATPIDQEATDLQLQMVSSPVAERNTPLPGTDAQQANTGFKRATKSLPVPTITEPDATRHLPPMQTQANTTQGDQSFAYHFSAIGWKVCLLVCSSSRWLKIRVSVFPGACHRLTLTTIRFEFCNSDQRSIRNSHSK